MPQTILGYMDYCGVAMDMFGLWLVDFSLVLCAAVLSVLPMEIA
jgi:hypothetical protein